jgi:hypothetical protein
MAVQLEARNASFTDLVALLSEQNARKVDLVAPADKITSLDGVITVHGSEMTEDGVEDFVGSYRPTDVFDEGLADKLGIPPKFLKRLRAERADLYDTNVNGLLHGRTEGFYSAVPADPRTFFIRAFHGDDGDGVARAFLSDRYGVIDNWDFAVAALDGVRKAGHEVKITGCDVSERRMYIRVDAPQLLVPAQHVLGNYRNPKTGDSAVDNSWVSAGFELRNSEVGDGAWRITPRITFLVCTNGQTIVKDMVRGAHLGSKMEEGVIRWSQETERRELALITSRTTDAVTTYLDVDYVKAQLDILAAAAGVKIERPEATVKKVTKDLLVPEAVANDIFASFIAGGSVTAGGLMQAFTATAQDVASPELAAYLEEKASKALVLAAAA